MKSAITLGKGAAELLGCNPADTHRFSPGTKRISSLLALHRSLLHLAYRSSALERKVSRTAAHESYFIAEHSNYLTQ